ncbi:glycine--tRNA ligase subunit beta, partial [PVC group bacterium]|nr:glycine--tRNA ligase subunit beta [PVC group bacterium]
MKKKKKKSKANKKTGCLLLEIGCEELPAGYIDEMFKIILKRKVMNDLGPLFGRLTEKWFEVDDVIVHATPRRIMVFVKNILLHQTELVSPGLFGPAKDRARDENGSWTKAALGFAKSLNVSPEKLSYKDRNGREHLFYDCPPDKGQSAQKVLPDIIQKWILSLKFPKSMRWDPNNLIRFARPIRSVVALLDKKVINFSIGKVKSGRISYGHRFLKGRTPIVRLTEANINQYKKKMKAAGVIIDFEERKSIIVKGLKKHSQGNVSFDKALIDEVANLVEYPVVLTGTFHKRFLELPGCVLESAMKSHQRYFPLHNKKGKLLPKFVFVANGVAKGASGGIVKGNEKVLAARLSDAEFFFKEDTKTTLADKSERLKSVVFLKETKTSYFEKQEHVSDVCKLMAENLKLSSGELETLLRASVLSKADLVTHMVGEFPDLQGQMGKEYALFDKEAPAAAEAIKEHYLPRFSGDVLPQTKIGAVLAFSDKLNTIVSCFDAGIEVT